jgi:hypothetical protein
MDGHAGRGRAALSRVVVRDRAEELGCLSYVSIAVNDDRGVTAEFQVKAFRIRRDGGRDLMGADTAGAWLGRGRSGG